MRIRSLSAVGAAAAGLALVAAPAFAGAPYNVSGSVTTVTAKGNTVLTAGTQTLTCTNSSLQVTPNVGAAVNNPVANVTAASWTGCTWVGGIAATVTVTSPNWAFNISSGTNTSGLTDSFNGTLTNISNVRISLSTGCAFNVNGSVGGYFDEDNGKGGQELGVTSSSLLVSNVNSAFLCLGLVSNGQSATFSGTYNSASQSINHARRTTILAR